MVSNCISRVIYQKLDTAIKILLDLINWRPMMDLNQLDIRTIPLRGIVPVNHV